MSTADPDEIWAALTPQQKQTLVIAGAVFLTDPALEHLQASAHVARSRGEKKKPEPTNKVSAGESPAGRPANSERSAQGRDVQVKSEV